MFLGKNGNILLIIKKKTKKKNKTKQKKQKNKQTNQKKCLQKKKLNDIASKYTEKKTLV